MRHAAPLFLALVALVLMPACGGSSGGGTTSSGPEVLTFTFTRIVGSGDMISVGTFNDHGFSDDPGIGSTGVVASECNVDSTGGFIIFDGTNFHLHAVQGTARPGGAGMWSSSIENGVVDQGFTSFEDDVAGGGIFIVPNDGSAPVATIANALTVVPDSSGMPLVGNPTFTRFGEHGRSGSLTLFGAFRNNGSDIKGLYMDNGGTLTLMFEEGQVHPLLGGNVMDISEAHVRDGDWSVTVATSTNEGIVASFGGTQTVAVDQMDAVPSGLGTFTSFGESSISGNRLVFQGRNSSSTLFGIYMYDHDTMTLSTIADETTPLPSGSSNFDEAVDPAISGDYVAFRSGSPEAGIYLKNLRDGTVHSVLLIGQMLDGKTITSINKREAYMVNGNYMGLNVTFSDNSTAIYTVLIGTP